MYLCIIHNIKYKLYNTMLNINTHIYLFVSRLPQWRKQWGLVALWVALVSISLSLVLLRWGLKNLPEGREVLNHVVKLEVHSYVAQWTVPSNLLIKPSSYENEHRLPIKNKTKYPVLLPYYADNLESDQLSQAIV